MMPEWQFTLVSGNQSRQTIIKDNHKKVIFLSYKVGESRVFRLALVSGNQLKNYEYKRTTQKVVFVCLIATYIPYIMMCQSCLYG
jgi:hypothetical protein